MRMLLPATAEVAESGFRSLGVAGSHQSCDRMGFANGGGDGFELPILAVMTDSMEHHWIWKRCLLSRCLDLEMADLLPIEMKTLPAVAGRSLPTESRQI
ncbi:hypothetical protein ACLOJK_034653 [Asimina triloba]